ncbi:hypothetical protein FQR65_LT06504 [Abscondita terminalis]|nr:hypothetical protein FQR65_LT06504 [Abscondita terminalis]
MKAEDAPQSTSMTGDRHIIHLLHFPTVEVCSMSLPKESISEEEARTTLLRCFNLNSSLNKDSSSEDPDDDDNNDIAVVEHELPLPAIFRDTDFNPDSDQHTENEENNMLLANLKVTRF